MHTVTEILTYRAHSRTYAVKVDAVQALERWNAGRSLSQIRDELAPRASRLAVYRALKRAMRAGGVAIPHDKKGRLKPCPAQR